MDNFVGIVVLIALAELTAFGLHTFLDPNSHLSMIQECEKSLPRDQHCKLIAVPEKL